MRWPICIRRKLDDALSIIEDQRNFIRRLQERNNELEITNKEIKNLRHDNRLIVENIGSNQLTSLIHSGLLKGDYLR